MSEVAQIKTDMFVKMWCALNVASDVSSEPSLLSPQNKHSKSLIPTTVMILPLWMLHTLQMRAGQKVALAALFTLGMIDIIFDVLRTIYTVNGGAFALNTLWDILEPTIAVIISCLPTYASLFKPTQSKKSSSYKALAYRSDGSFLKPGSRITNSGAQRSQPGMSQRDPLASYTSVEATGGRGMRGHEFV